MRASVDSEPRTTRSKPVRSMAFAKTSEVANASEPCRASSTTCTASSAPIESAFRTVSAAPAGPIVRTTTVLPSFASLMRSASSTAYVSSSSMTPSAAARSSVWSAGSSRFSDHVSGTCLTQHHDPQRTTHRSRLLVGRLYRASANVASMDQRLRASMRPIHRRPARRLWPARVRRPDSRLVTRRRPCWSCKARRTPARRPARRSSPTGFRRQRPARVRHPRGASVQSVDAPAELRPLLLRPRVRTGERPRGCETRPPRPVAGRRRHDDRGTRRGARATGVGAARRIHRTGLGGQPDGAACHCGAGCARQTDAASARCSGARFA